MKKLVDLGSFELEGTVYRYKKPIVKVVRDVDRVKAEVTGEIPDILKRTPKEDAPLDVWEAYNEASGKYSEEVSTRLIEKWGDYVRAMVENPDEKLLDVDNLMMAEMWGIVQGFRTAAVKMTRIHNAAYVSSTTSGPN